MSDAPTRKRFRLWLTVSEIVGVLALVIAGLNFWDSHRERQDQARREAAAAQESAVRSSLVLTASADADGARLALQPLDGGQAIQSQRYLFPHAVLGHAMEVAAAKPQIDLGWIEGALTGEVAKARKAGAAADGEGDIPVGVYTTYAEGGEMRTDAALYRLGYAWRGRLIGGPRLALQGLSLIRREAPAGLRRAVEAAWSRR